MSAQRQNISNETAALYATQDRSDRYTADALKKIQSEINKLQDLASGYPSSIAVSMVTISHA